MQIKVLRCCRGINYQMHAFLFTCPATSQWVQAWTAAEQPLPDFESVKCTACGRMHLVSPDTSKVAGAETERKPTVR